MKKWFDIPGYEGLYKITDCGIIKNKKNKIIAPWKRGGYWAIELSRNDVQKKHSIARLVGNTFIPNPDNKPYINHLNGNKLDNRKENLEWATAKENVQHAINILKKHPAVNASNKSLRHPNWGMGHKGKFNENHPKSKPITRFTLDGQVVKRYPSISEAARELKCPHQNIRANLTGARKTHLGHKWQYCTD